VNTILAITVGLIINGIIAFGIAKVSRSLWMVAKERKKKKLKH